ncbi:glycine cleavage system protein GcvH [Pelagibacterium halotolerans]|uniref:Glycine cleavage system H protein n=1 Tax=Pelagibacterium halotolerans (strain DSM 22347 / JCM 15775 / CGMCC 1.7692 / B2) TaxID=1082931 RepID=G4RB43_PELHB|nr:glycine cleavage system protein GcvH [Pelagibacterium halotolerans]AEQ50552.1 glycine cleavage system H protein [Pelagibacterium halotolerans B2]QJR19499.1 glycine cleavage system protein GcvH [Pelagibacterium halotolerans]SDZ89621.1 glycine cleavage system H protein [Pelagibacterium halotolerans]
MTTRYTTDHEYVRAEGKIGTVGISSFAQEQLGDIVFVELPAVGASFKKGEEVAVVESVKAASEIYAPVSGTVTEINETLSDEPGLINSDPAAAGWIFKLELADEAELEGLMDEAAYADHTA